MPDISMCNGNNCPIKDTCYRFMAIPDDLWQSYFIESPIKEDGKCDYYWEYVKPKVDKKKKK